ncbi:DMT family transporter [Anaeromyxobacter oryzae]|uniref:Membrane protein n=1 Tax=Anaeromyxobacter oryzae TaxID=2918170 RepID=A0ABN6MTF7_9BACT|nr:DMT family transporter [Anaeromyxobacter oryzae]BDG04191.1 membrane protein [Anaeromyxobacter oryzae]
MPRDRLIGLSCAVLSVLLFSSFTLVSRLGLSSSLTLPDLAALRFGIGGTVLLPVLLRRDLRGVAWRDAAALALFGGLGFALLAYAGFALAPAAHGAVLLHGTLPLFTYAILSATARRRGPRHRTAGIVLIAMGVALMAYDSLAVASARQLLGDGFLLLASLFWSAYGVLSRRRGLPPATGAAIVAVLSSCAFLPVYALWPGKALLVVGTRELLLQAIVQGVLIGAVSIFVYTRAVAALGPAATALFAAAVPCVTTVAAIPLLSEHPSTVALAGVGVVTLGMIVAARLPRGER